MECTFIFNESLILLYFWLSCSILCSRHQNLEKTLDSEIVMGQYYVCKINHYWRFFKKLGKHHRSYVNSNVKFPKGTDEWCLQILAECLYFRTQVLRWLQRSDLMCNHLQMAQLRDCMCMYISIGGIILVIWRYIIKCWNAIMYLLEHKSWGRIVYELNMIRAGSLEPWNLSHILFPCVQG